MQEIIQDFQYVEFRIKLLIEEDKIECAFIYIYIIYVTLNIALTDFLYCLFMFFPHPVLFLWNFPSPARATTGVFHMFLKK